MIDIMIRPLNGDHRKELRFVNKQDTTLSGYEPPRIIVRIYDDEHGIWTEEVFVIDKFTGFHTDSVTDALRMILS